MEKKKEFEIKEKVDELAKLTQEQKEMKVKIDDLKAYFEKLATEQLKDTKIKTTEYWGSGNSKIIVGNSETVKIVSVTMLEKLFGTLFKDLFKEKKTQEPTDPSKRLLAMVFMGNYTEGCMDHTIASISDDANIQKTLKKKLKGKYEQDKNTLMSIAGLEQQEASDWAYLVSEVANWENLIQILKVSEWAGNIQEAIDIIKTAIIVEEGIKVTISTEKEK